MAKEKELIYNFQINILILNHKKISAENVFNNVPSYLGLAQTSQSITADASSQVADVTSAITEINATSATGAISLADGSD